ncbi:MAG TPA: HAD family phosphatase [Candidatus Saccharimonadales bacterium]
MIEVVLFDYGGVLTEGGTVGSMARLVARVMDVPEGRTAPARPLMEGLLLGTLSTDDFLRELAALYPEAPQPTKRRLLQSAEIFEPCSVVYELAERVRKAGIRTAILSNMFSVSAEALRKKGLYDDFDPVILSCDEHLAKPQPQIYEHTLSRLGVPAEAVLFIDDQPRFLTPAEQMGMHTILAQSPQQIVADTEAAILAANGRELPLLQ